MKRTLLLLPLVLAAAACATRGDFPSLAPRAVERLSMEEPVRVDPAVAADPALRAQAQAMLGRAQRGDRLFEEAYTDASRAAQAAGAPNSDGWIAAQQAITRVEAARGGTTAAAADLDALLIARADTPTNPEDHRMLTDALTAARGIVADQQRRLDALRGRIRTP